MLGFRADFFNIFNIASYGYPDNGINDSSFGQISSVRSPQRQMQLSLHYQFLVRAFFWGPLFVQAWTAARLLS